MSVLIETSVGEFTIDLYCEERPKCCLNFLKLCKIKYYNYCLFHSIQERLVAQAGDPSGTGNGGYSIWQKLTGEKYFQNEIKPKIKHNKTGLISMVNNGSNMHGSQFCITLSDNLDYLDGKHTVFGQISEGFDVVKKLNNVFVDKNNIPLQDVRIYHTIILDDPFSDPIGLNIPEYSPEPHESQLNSGRVGAEEDLSANRDVTEEDLAELERMKEARANAQILTVIGDIPDEDIKPPDNVLFVCSLNPSTCSEDLELIFSRFGEILSCEVIRDHKTGSSLQYAFIEFINKEDCEKAYFDMERVLIDDRRIHVDFSQSVSKQWHMYRADKKERKYQNEGVTNYQRKTERKPQPEIEFSKEKDCSTRRHKEKRDRSKDRRNNRCREMSYEKRDRSKIGIRDRSRELNRTDQERTHRSRNRNYNESNSQRQKDEGSERSREGKIAHRDSYDKKNEKKSMKSKRENSKDRGNHHRRKHS